MTAQFSEDPDRSAECAVRVLSPTAADIVEEMAPDEAADILAGLNEETSQEILEEMEHDPKSEVSELMDFEEDTAGGMMNTECVALTEPATVADAIAALKTNEELLETLNTVFLVDAQERLIGAPMRAGTLMPLNASTDVGGKGRYICLPWRPLIPRSG